MNVSALKKKASIPFVALLIAASSSLSGCIQQNSNYQDIVNTIENVDVGKGEQKKIADTGSTLNYGNINSTDQLFLLKQELKNAIHNLDKTNSERQFYQAILVFVNQITSLDKQVDTIQSVLDMAREGKASDNVFDYQVLQNIHKISVGGKDTFSLSKLEDLYHVSQNAGFNITVFADILSRLGQTLGDKSGLKDKLSEQQLMALDLESSRTLGQIQIILRNI